MDVNLIILLVFGLIIGTQIKKIIEVFKSIINIVVIFIVFLLIIMFIGFDGNLNSYLNYISNIDFLAIGNEINILIIDANLTQHIPTTPKN